MKRILFSLFIFLVLVSCTPSENADESFWQLPLIGESVVEDEDKDDDDDNKGDEIDEKTTVVDFSEENPIIWVDALARNVYEKGENTTFPCYGEWRQEKIDCSIDEFSTQKTGEFNIAISIVDDFGETVEYNYTYYVLNDKDLLDVEMNEYPEFEGLFGDELRKAIAVYQRKLIDGISYNNVVGVLQDAYGVEGDHVMEIYTSELIPSNWDLKEWQREHIWPQSKLSSRSSTYGTNIASDVFNLAPATGITNIRKSNHFLSEDMLITVKDEWKGLSARSVFYMYSTYLELEIGNTDDDYDGSMMMGELDVLIEWHETFNPSDFEYNLNDTYESYQGNRNVFIDYPHLVELLFFDHEYYSD